MPTSTTSPNMNLVIPTVGQEPGPTYAFDINAALTLIDQHDHTNGKGVQITPQGLNLNSTVTMVGTSGQGIVNLSKLSLVPQSSTPPTNTIYESGVDLYYVDGNSNNIRLTLNGAVNGTPGSIANLVAPASASYVASSQKFVWQSDVNTAANMDFGSAIMRNISPNSTFALTLSPPAGLSSNYNIVLPTLPGSQLFVTLDTSGNLGTASNIQGTQIAANSLTGTQLANTTVTGNKIAAATITGSNIAAATITGSNVAGGTIAGSNIATGASGIGISNMANANVVVSSSSGLFSQGVGGGSTQITHFSISIFAYPNRPVKIFIVPDGSVSSFPPVTQPAQFTTASESNVALFKNGTVLQCWSMFASQNPPMFIDYNASGLTTYSILVQTPSGSSGVFVCYNQVMVAIQD